MKDKVRTLFFYPYLNFDTGSPKAMAQFIDLLDRDMFAPVYAAGGTGPLTVELAARGVEIVSWSTDMISVSQPLAAFAALRKQMNLLRSWKIDLIHANCFPWNSDLILAAWLLRIPVILHAHNPVDISLQNLVRLPARKVLFCSSALMMGCKHLHRIAAKAEVFHNIIDVAAWGQGHSIRQRLGLADEEIAIGTVAQVVPRKGIDILLETARILLRKRNDLVFLIAGPQVSDEGEFGRAMMRMAADEAAFRGRVRFLGSRSDIADFMASLDVFVLPTRAEPLGIVILEAMAVGLPVVASKVGGIPEILTSPELGNLVDPITPEAFATSIEEVLSRPDRGKSMGASAKASLTGRFDLATGRQHLKRIYLEALGAS